VFIKRIVAVEGDEIEVGWPQSLGPLPYCVKPCIIVLHPLRGGEVQPIGTLETECVHVCARVRAWVRAHASYVHVCHKHWEPSATYFLKMNQMVAFFTVLTQRAQARYWQFCVSPFIFKLMFNAFGVGGTTWQCNWKEGISD